MLAAKKVHNLDFVLLFFAIAKQAPVPEKMHKIKFRSIKSSLKRKERKGEEISSDKEN